MLRLIFPLLVLALLLPAPLLAQEDGAALVEAARRGDIHEVERLLEVGADVDARDEYDETALMLASAMGHSDIVTLLLAAGADVDVHPIDGMTALMLASMMGHSDIVTLLLAAGTDVDAQATGDLTALHYAIFGENQAFLFQVLPPELLDAVGQGHTDIVSLLLAVGASVDVQDANGITALFYAILMGNTDFVTLLLAAGANVDVQATNSLTALMFASMMGHSEIVTLLLAAGAIVDAQAIDGITALHAAILGESQTFLMMLPAPFALGQGHTEIIMLLLDAGADLSGQISIFALWITTDLEIFNLLLNAGADPEVAEISPLMIAAFKGETTTVLRLLRSGADPEPALRFAVLSGDYVMVSILLGAGADLNWQDKFGYGWTALMLASLQGDVEIVELLLTAGADPHLLDSRDISALEFATHPEITALLEAAMEE